MVQRATDGAVNGSAALIGDDQRMRHALSAVPIGHVCRRYHCRDCGDDLPRRRPASTSTRSGASPPTTARWSTASCHARPDRRRDRTRGARARGQAWRTSCGRGAGAHATPWRRRSGLDIATGFVTGYLDGTEVAARDRRARGGVPGAVHRSSTLPFATSGYDGLASGDRPAPPRCSLRITDDTSASDRGPASCSIGGTHAREWMNPLIAIEFAEQLLNNYDPASADPDGAGDHRIVDGGRRPHRAGAQPGRADLLDPRRRRLAQEPTPERGRAGCPGVDNNRNYEVYFGGAGSSTSACSRPTAARSRSRRPRTATSAGVLEQFPNMLVGVDAHSFGQQILRPGPGGGTFISSLPVSAADDAIYTGARDDAPHRDPVGERRQLLDRGRPATMPAPPTSTCSSRTASSASTRECGTGLPAARGPSAVPSSTRSSTGCARSRWRPSTSRSRRRRRCDSSSASTAPAAWSPSATTAPRARTRSVSST